MDLAYWGLRERPFRISVAPHGAFSLPAQESVRQQIIQAFQNGERVAVLSGPHGVGKSLVAQQVVADYEAAGLASAWAACVPHAGSQALFQMFLADLGQPFSIRSAIELRLQLIEQILPMIQEGKSILLVNDEAHHLAPEILEHLRPLVEIISPLGSPAVQVLLVGTEQLLQQLMQPEAAGLYAWVGCRPSLLPLDTQTAEQFLRSQWQQAGGHPERQATAEAWTMLAELGQGIPLMLNRLARSAFHLAQEMELATLDAEAVWEAGIDLGLADPQGLDADQDQTVPMPVRPSLKESA